MFHSLRRPDVLAVTLAAAGILMVTMGIRQSFGLFVSPINTATGMGIAAISLALAVGQFAWGAIQPIAGAVADRYGPRAVLIGGLILLAAGCAATPFIDGGFGLTVTLGLLAATGVINAGGSFGQFVFAPILQKLIQSIGWMGALWAMAVAALAALPLIGKLTAGSAPPPPRADGEAHLGRVVLDALKAPNYLLLHAGFFTCGFHIAFLVTHLPGEVNLCGLPPTVASWSLAIIGLANIFGSLYAGGCIARYLMAPRTELTDYLFAAGLGFTWLATVPPTAALVGKLFGTRYLATLFGLTLLSHQIGGFLGAWLSGIAITRYGDFTWMWYADMVLAALAALVNLPIREAPIARPAAP